MYKYIEWFENCKVAGFAYNIYVLTFFHKLRPIDIKNTK